MARSDGKFTRGKIGPHVYKEHRGKQVIQQLPIFTETSHTEPSKKSAKIFGMASNLAMHLRDSLHPVVTDFSDGTMVNRLNSDVVHILNQSKNTSFGGFSFHKESFSRLNGFEFNEHSLVRDIFYARPEVTANENLLKVIVPEMELPKEFIFPEQIGLCLLSFGLGMYDLTNGRLKFNPVQSTEITYNYKHRIVPENRFEFEIEPGCLCVTVISLQFLRNTFAGKMFYNTIDYNPVAILKAFIADGTVDESRTASWYEMDFKVGSV